MLGFKLQEVEDGVQELMNFVSEEDYDSALETVDILIDELRKIERIMEKLL